MTRITSDMIGVAVACVCLNAVGAVEFDKDAPGPVNIYMLAMLTGRYVSEARACKADEWKPALGESIIQVQKWEPASDLKYFRLVIEWANKFHARDCDQTKLLTTRRERRAYLDSSTRYPFPKCKLNPHLVC